MSKMIKVKCLWDGQMAFIKNNHGQMTARQMAEKLQVEHHKVTLFCQANSYQPVPDGNRKSRKDCFHTITAAQKLRKSRKKYQGPLKKAALNERG